jgi:hypothetical protein
MGLLVKIVQPNVPFAYKESYENKKLVLSEGFGRQFCGFDRVRPWEQPGLPLQVTTAMNPLTR